MSNSVVSWMQLVWKSSVGLHPVLIIHQTPKEKAGTPTPGAYKSRVYYHYHYIWSLFQVNLDRPVPFQVLLHHYIWSLFQVNLDRPVPFQVLLHLFLLNEQLLNVPLAHNRSFRGTVFPGNQPHWYWQHKITITQKYQDTQNLPKTQQ